MIYILRKISRSRQENKDEPQEARSCCELKPFQVSQGLGDMCSPLFSLFIPVFVIFKDEKIYFNNVDTFLILINLWNLADLTVIPLVILLIDQIHSLHTMGVDALIDCHSLLLN